MKYLLLLITLLIAVPVYSGGLIDEEDTAVSGIKKKYLRSPYIGMSNPLGGIPTLEFTIEKAIIDADGDTSTKFMGRNTLSAATYAGMKIPEINENTGLQTGTFRNDSFYRWVYSLTVLSIKQSKGQVGFVPNSSPVTICYVTSSTPDCVLPEVAQ